MGRVEFSYLEKCSDEERKTRIEKFFASKIPAVILSRGLEPFPEMVELAEYFGVTYRKDFLVL